MIVKHNLTAMNSNIMLGITANTQAKSTEKLSSGYKINRAADDAAGLAISEKMRRQVRGLTQASANAEDGISCVQTAEGALNEVHDMLQRIGELAVKGETGTLTSVDREFVRQEINQLMSEVDRVQSTTTFNEQSLLDGTFTNKNLQVGAEASQYITVTIKAMDMSNLATYAEKYGWSSTGSGKTDFDQDTTGLKAKFYCGTESTVEVTATDFASLNKFTKAAQKAVSAQRSQLGSIQNRLEHTISNLDNIIENTTSAEAAIRDTDMASEMVKYSNNSILQQAGQAMLAQANQSNQGVLSLLG